MTFHLLPLCRENAFRAASSLALCSVVLAGWNIQTAAASHPELLKFRVVHKKLIWQVR